MQGPVTLKMVGESCGCSATTVSQVLRGIGKVSATRRNEILAVARRLGYQRDASASLLRSRRGATSSEGMPVVYLEKRAVIPGVPFMIIQNIGDHAKAMGYKLEQRHYSTVAELAAILRELAYRRVDVILLGNIERDAWAEGIDWSPFIVLALWRFGYSYPFHTIRYNYYQAIRQLFAKAFDAGYRRIGLVCFMHRTSVLDDDSRKAAVDEARRLYQGRAEILPPLYYYDMPINERLAGWVAEHNPDVVIGFNSGVSHALTVIGKRIPEDCAFCTLHDCKESHAILDASGFVVESDSIAVLVVSMIDAFQRQNSRGELEFVTETLMTMKFNPGDTMPNIRLPAEVSVSAMA